MNWQKWVRAKAAGQKFSMITCYDYSMAQIVENSDIDTILVGDSASMVMHGHPNTVHATMDMMATHTNAVARGAPSKWIVGDMPFGSYRKDLKTNMENLELLMRAGAHAIKIEGALGNLDLVSHATQSGIPLIVHLGLTPQSTHTLGGFRVQSRTQEAADALTVQALQCQEAGAVAIVLECIPSAVAQAVTEQLTIPTIGIGAGPHVDGQVLVLQDMLGMNPEFRPKFLRTYLNGFNMIQGALNHYHQDVTAGNFPSQQEAYA